LHDMNKGGNLAAGKAAAETPLDVYKCPTRPSPLTHPFVNGTPPKNIAKPAVMAPTDYAGNGGDYFSYISDGPESYDDAKTWDTKKWAEQRGGINPNGLKESNGSLKLSNGIFVVHAVVKPVEITDGSSKTYLVGERYIFPEGYTAADYSGNDQGWDMGYDYDINRWTGNALDYQPKRDRSGADNVLCFGSAHSHACNFVFCDGSVHAIRYDIDVETNRRLGNRMDKLPIDGSLW
jgi:prepilin-type processing-associated H-X9-DG protein